MARPRGRVEPKNIRHLIELSYLRHRRTLGLLPRITAPSWDSVALGWVGPVKDQGQCGSCWDFSGTGIVEIALNKAGIGGGTAAMILSEEYTLDCCQNGGCNGDDNTTVLMWAKSNGLPLTSAYGPYTMGGKCAYNSAEKLFKIDDWGFADQNGGQGVTSTADIKAAIAAYGAAGAAIAADDAFEQWGDNNPVLTKPFAGSGSKDIDHDIILVGWQDDASNPAGGYWKLRNSWGAAWGVGGYMTINYGANQVGTEAVFAVVNPVVPPAPGPAPTPGPTPPAPVPPAPVPAGITGTYTVVSPRVGSQRTLVFMGGLLTSVTPP